MVVKALNGKWKLKYFRFGQGNIHYSNRGKELVGKVPGGVHQDLIKSGVIKEPLIGLNIEKCKWIEDREWWYTKEFTLSSSCQSDRVELCFEGLDGQSIIWLNGKKIGEHNNAFIPYTIDVTQNIKVGVNILKVKLTNGISSIKKKPLRKYLASENEKHPRNNRIWLRKAQFSFGWDWAPRLINCGIWRDVKLNIYNKVAIRNVQLISRIHGKEAIVKVMVEIENFLDREIKLKCAMKLKNELEHFSSFNVMLKPGLNRIKKTIGVKKVKLWWPRGYGEANLYKFLFKIQESNITLDEYSSNYGIREVKLLQTKLSNGGKSFTFVINGKKVFCKGANWVPADSIISRVKKRKYEQLIKLAAEANFNMLRVWGGGIYENPIFYKLCDEYGIMIWQDFMYACALYPDDDRAFFQAVKKEAEAVVKTLRNYASIVIWSGNNECIDVWEQGGNKVLKRFYGKRIWYEMLPKTCRKLDHTRPYRPCSPFGGAYSNDESEGDSHNLHSTCTEEEEINYKSYEKNGAKFASEFYFTHSIPDRKSIKKYLPVSEQDIGSGSWQFHDNFQFRNMNNALEHYYKSPTIMNMDEYITASQILQGETLKFIIEHYRRRKYDCSGCLFWMYNDCWGTIGWSIVDYYLNTKASYYYVKRAYSPVLVSFKEEPGGLSIWLINDTLDNIDGVLEYGRKGFNGFVLEKGNIAVRVKANSVKKILQVSTSLVHWMYSTGSFYYAKFKVKGEIISENRHLFTSFKGLLYGGRKYLMGKHMKDNPFSMISSRVKIESKLKKLNKGEYVLSLKSDTYALAVEVKGPEGMKCSDNYFDILPNDIKVIKLKGENVSERVLSIRPFNRYFKVTKNVTSLRK